MAFGILLGLQWPFWVALLRRRAWPWRLLMVMTSGAFVLTLIYNMRSGSDVAPNPSSLVGHDIASRSSGVIAAVWTTVLYFAPIAALLTNPFILE